jgi:anaerobic dimethyl sulfoxide reductase subunit B (iron-sulfur subunit)
MQIGFYFDQTRCTGCFTCVVACKDWYDVPAGPASYTRVFQFEKGKYPNLFAAYLRTACYHCTQPACETACPAGAISKRTEDGIVVVDQDLCLGKSCGACLEACPYSAPQFRDDNATMEKCNLCMERWQEGKKPICVEGCPMRALDAGPIDELKEKYGDITEATGFTYNKECMPSVVFKPKKIVFTPASVK